MSRERHRVTWLTTTHRGRRTLLLLLSSSVRTRRRRRSSTGKGGSVCVCVQQRESWTRPAGERLVAVELYEWCIIQINSS